MNEGVAAKGPLGPGVRFGRYEILRELGRGGMATVFEARHADLGKSIALKVMHAVVAADEEAVRRAAREGRAATAIRHPHVVEMFDFGLEGGLPYLAMELLRGEDLAAKLRREGPMSERETAEILLPVIAAIAAAHDAGVIHRDLKPSNIFLSVTHDGAVKPMVVDFGISRWSEGEPNGAHATGTHAFLGTLHYASPEQARGAKNVTAQSDQYALGVTMYECATGGTPFDGGDHYETMHAIMTARVVPPSELNPKIRRGFDAVVLKALERDPARRFPSARALGAALLPFASDEAQRKWRAELSSTERFDVSPLSTPGRGLSARTRPWVAAAALAVVGVMGVALLRPRAPVATREVSVSAPARAAVAQVLPVATASLEGPAPVVSIAAPLPSVEAPQARPAAPSRAIAPRAQAPRPHAKNETTSAAPPANELERGTGNMPILE